MAMNEVSHGNRPSAFRAMYLVLRNRLPLEGETAVFILASTLDAMLTRYLLSIGNSSDTWFVESNPIPRYFFESWGLDGLTYFKFALVALVTVICQIIARSKIDVARRVLNLASILVIGVDIYSVVLMTQHL
jgi:hypothetical protein